MRMKRQNPAKPAQRGFVLMLAVTIMALMAVVMVVLTAGSRTIQFHADSAYLQAVQGNLVQSGLAWAEHAVSSGLTQVPTGPVELDTGYPGSQEPRLTVDIQRHDGPVAKVVVEVTARKAGQRAADRQTHLIRIAESDARR